MTAKAEKLSTLSSAEAPEERWKEAESLPGIVE
jgi:hypothetical protein